MSQVKIMRSGQGLPTQDGDGVNLIRVMGGRHFRHHDPFLMLDEFGSEEAKDYIGGFPPHPHRGFQTITYMLAGKMRHTDHMGNVGLLSDGGVQWMNAGRGIIHSEMPEQSEGLMRGFQIWLNLPASAKMSDPWYRDIAPQDIPVVRQGEAEVKVISGHFGDQPGAVTDIGTGQAPIYLDVVLPQGQTLEWAVQAENQHLLYVYEGAVSLNDGQVRKGTIVALGEGEQLQVQADSDARFLFLSATPLNEPIAQYGPFVMNTQDEIQQAFSDYQAGTLALVAKGLSS